jgi:excisionase family DNA binding protein
MKLDFTEKQWNVIAVRVAKMLSEKNAMDQKLEEFGKIYNPDEVALLVNENVQTVRRKLRLKRIIGKKAGGSWRITEEALNKYIGKQNG